jgi:uncharacterized membrane protein YkoI
MKKLTWFWFFICSLAVILFFVIWQQWGILNPSADSLTKNEAKKLVQDRYQGTVSKIQSAKNQYLIDLKMEQKVYRIKIDVEKAEILSFTEIESHSGQPEPAPKSELTETKIKKIVLANANGVISQLIKVKENGVMRYKAVVNDRDEQISLTVDAATGKIVSKQSNKIIPPSDKMLTETQATRIAKKQVQGTIHHIGFQSKNNSSYYLVEVETNKGQEAIVQIHSITGEVMSVTWDDHDKDHGKEDKKEDDD